MTTIIRSNAKDTDAWARAIAAVHARRAALTQQEGLVHAVAPSEDGLFDRDAHYSHDELSKDAEPSEPERETVEAIEGEERPTTDVEWAETPATFEASPAQAAANPLPGAEGDAYCAVTAAIDRLSVFVDSVCDERPSDEASGWEPGFDMGAPARQRGSAVRRLGYEVARIVKITDARFDRIEIVAANQTAELRIEFEQMIAELVTRIEQVESRSALATAEGDHGHIVTAPEEPRDELHTSSELGEPDKVGTSHVDAEKNFWSQVRESLFHRYL